MALMFKKLTLLPVIFLLMLFAGPAGQAAAEEAPPPPLIGGRAAVLINADSGRVLYSFNQDERLPMASTTKMMTALLIIENHSDLSARVTASQRAAEVGESSIWLTAGETLTVHEMLTGLLVQSGNDAAMALAEFDAGSMEAFVEKMNKRAQELGMNNTHFVNPHGLDDSQHYTSAADFARLGVEVMKHPVLRDIVKNYQAAIPWTGQPYGRTLTNHNYLLNHSPLIGGVKTGFTDVAGQCIVISANSNGTNLILAYLGGPSLAQRDQDVMNLINFGFDNYRTMALFSRDKEYASVAVPYHWGSSLSLVAPEDVSRPVCVSSRIDYRISLPDSPRLPVRKGDKVGVIEAYDGDFLVGSSYLLATDDYNMPGLGDKLAYYIEAVFHLFTAV